MTSPDTRLLLKKLDALRTELVDMAFVLDRRGSPEAADVALTISSRVVELCEELAPDFGEVLRSPVRAERVSSLNR